MIFVLSLCLCCVCRDHPTVIKRRFTSVLVVSGLSPLFVLVWREFTGIRVSGMTTDCGVMVMLEAS